MYIQGGMNGSHDFIVRVEYSWRRRWLFRRCWRVTFTVFVRDQKRSVTHAWL